MGALTYHSRAAAPAQPPAATRLLDLPGIDASLPDLQFVGPDGQPTPVPGGLWPDMALRAALDGAGRGRPLFACRPLATKREISDLLCAWSHPLHGDGESYDRPFGFQAFCLEVFGEPAAIAVSASAPNEAVFEDLGRYNTVDLARIAASPDPRFANCLRAVLRWWREFLAPLWTVYRGGWDIDAAVSYSLPGKAGHLYRADGFRKVAERRVKQRNSGGRQGASRAAKIAATPDLVMGVWVWRYPQPLRNGDPSIPRARLRSPGDQLDLALAA